MSRKLFFGSLFLVIGLGILLLSVCILGIPAIGTYLIRVGLILLGGLIVFIWSIRRFFGNKRANSILKNLIVLVAVIVFLFIISEFTIRFVFRDITTTGDGNSYFTGRWNKNNVCLNVWRFREREFESVKPDGIYRIAIIGDSFTYGQGIEEKDRFTYLLEKYLKRHNSKYEVLNFGRPGTETIDHIDVLKEVVFKTNPDFILLQWYTNDFEGHNKRNMPKLVPLVLSRKLDSILNRSSAIYYLINRQWTLLQNAFGLYGSYSEYMFRRFGDSESPDSKEYKSTLKCFINLCKDREVPLGIILFPRPFHNLVDDYPFDYLHNRVLEVCKQEGISSLDLRSTFAPYSVSESEYKKLWVNIFDRHPSSLANRLAAESIMKTFGMIWLSLHGPVDLLAIQN